MTLLACWVAACAGCGGQVEPEELYGVQPTRNAITFWGHATAYIDVDGFGIVTDPLFDEAYGLFHRRMIPVPPFSTFDETKIIFISHSHRDHLSLDTLERFPAAATILCSDEVAEYIVDAKQQVVTMEIDDEYAIPGGTITAVAANHASGRWSIKSTDDGSALGFVLATPAMTIYYTGDTDYFSGIKEIGDRFGPDLVLLNVNAHLHGEEAIWTIEDLGGPIVIPMHYGAYRNVNELRVPRWHEDLEAMLGPVFVPLGIGKSFPLARIEERRAAAAGASGRP